MGFLRGQHWVRRTFNTIRVGVAWFSKDQHKRPNTWMNGMFYNYGVIGPRDNDTKSTNVLGILLSRIPFRDPVVEDGGQTYIIFFESLGLVVSVVGLGQNLLQEIAVADRRPIGPLAVVQFRGLSAGIFPPTRHSIHRCWPNHGKCADRHVGQDVL